MRGSLSVLLLGTMVVPSLVQAQTLPSGKATAATQSRGVFHDDEPTVTRGLPGLERQTKGPFAWSLAYVPPEDKSPWYLWIGKGQVELEWSPAGWADSQEVFPFEKAVAVVTKNVCGVSLLDDPKGGRVSKLSQRENHVNAAHPASPRKLRLFPLIAAPYFMVAGGPFGLEDIVQKSGYLGTFVILLLTPLFWSLPTTLMVNSKAPSIR